MSYGELSNNIWWVGCQGFWVSLAIFGGKQLKKMIGLKLITIFGRGNGFDFVNLFSSFFNCEVERSDCLVVQALLYQPLLWTPLCSNSIASLGEIIDKFGRDVRHVWNVDWGVRPFEIRKWKWNLSMHHNVGELEESKTKCASLC